jgi:hypothetical protein
MNKILRLYEFKKTTKYQETSLQPSRVLRGNELYRLKSIQNKRVRKIPLSEADKQDVEEIRGIEEGRIPPVQPEDNFYQPAFTRNMDGTVCWYQRLQDGPLRELTKEERRLWNQLGPVGFLGYIRTDGSIRAYHLSGCLMPDSK